MNRVAESWARLDRTRRLALFVLFAGIAGTIALWAYLGSQVPYEVAFGHVKQEDAAALVDQLKTQQIPYQLTSEVDGTITIRVPSYLADEARIRVAGSGVLQGNTIGYEIFNQPSFGLSDFVQKVDYQRALEGELARSITQIDSVDTARVHLAIPQPSLFLSQQRDPSAAVVIGLKTGRKMDSSQAKAIVNLVVGAVEGMKATNVVLIDTRGQVLHAGDTPGGADSGAVNDQYTIQRGMERDLETRLQDMFDRVLGPGKSSVQVTLGLDWTQGQVTSETYLPNNAQPAVRTSQDVHDVQPSGGAIPRGVPGVQSNVPVYQQLTPTPGSTPATPAGASEHTESSRTYELSRTVEKTQLQPGAIKRVSVAIAVDSSVADAASIDRLTKMAEAAVGYDAKRGDTVAIVPVSMKAISTPTPGIPRSTQSKNLELARIAALAIGPVLAVIVLGVLLLRRRPRTRSGRIGSRALPAPANFLPTAFDVPERALGPEARRAIIREQLEELADKHPALIAEALQTWMNEDGGGRA